MLKKKKIILTLMVLIAMAIVLLFSLKSCNKKEPHVHIYKINEKGTWLCKEDGDILSNTDKPYVAILENDEPKEIIAVNQIPSTKIKYGNGVIYRKDNVIYYEGDDCQTIIIKTEKDTNKKDKIIINAPNDNIYHYGSSTTICLNAVATTSHHECGEVELITLTKARIVLENSSDVKEIYLDINDINYKYETSIIALKEKVELPALTRCGVELEDGEVKTLAIVQEVRDEVETKINSQTNEEIETKKEIILTENTTYVKIQNVRNSNKELIIEAFLSPNENEEDSYKIENQSTSTITLEEAKEGSTHTASLNTFLSKDEKINGTIQEEKENTSTAVKKETKETETKKEEQTIVPHTHKYVLTDLGSSHHAKVCACGSVIDVENHVDSESDGICDICHHGAIARINDVYYTDAEVAFNAAEEDEKVVILANCKVNLSNIPYEIAFDLNNKTMETVEIDKVPIPATGSADAKYGHISLFGFTALYNTNWELLETKYLALDDNTQYIAYNGSSYYYTKGTSYAQYADSYPSYFITGFKDSETKIRTVKNSFDGNTTALKLFESGYGTAEKPYLISKAQELRNISELCYIGTRGYSRFNDEEIFYKLSKNISIKNELKSDYTKHGQNRTSVIYTWYPCLPSINLNLNGHIIKDIDRDIIGYVDNAYIHDGTFEFVDPGAWTPGVINTVFGDTNGSVTFENLTLTGQANGDLGAHYGPLVSFAYNITKTINITAKNVISYLKYTNSSSSAYSGGLFGYVQGNGVSLTISDCMVSGSVQSANAGGFVGGTTNPKSTQCTDNVLNGTVIGAVYADAYGTSAATVNTTDANVGVSSPSVLFDISSASIGDEIIIDHSNSNIDHYVVNICTYIHGSKDGIGGLPRYIKSIVQVNNPSTVQQVESGLYVNKIVEAESPDLEKENILYGLTNDERIWREGDTYYYYGGMQGQKGIITNPGTVYINIYGYSSSNQLVTYQNCSYTHN